MLSKRKQADKVACSRAVPRQKNEELVAHNLFLEKYQFNEAIHGNPQLRLIIEFFHFSKTDFYRYGPGFCEVKTSITIFRIT